MELLNELNEPQRQACLQVEGPVLVLAGAGSGKTRTLTYRIAYLIRHCGVHPSQILAFTFTNKAAREMKSRIHALVGSDGRFMWVGTFHSVAVRLLRENIQHLGYDDRFVVYDADDTKALLRDIVKELNWDEKEWPASLFQNAVSRAKNRFMSPQNWDDHSYFGERVREVYTRYQKRLQALNALDFDDLIFQSVVLLDTKEEIRAHYQQRFRHVLVDEYQDTNLAQYQFIRHLAGGSGNLCAVGDDDQSIYGWRGADMRNILEFQRDFPGATIIRLEQNYRSTGIILDAANALVRHNRERLGKELWTQKEIGETVRLYRAPDEESEAWYAAEVIHEAVRRGHKLSDCAVLYRTNAQSRAFEMALSRAGISYRLVGGKRFYERKEVKDVLAYLRVVFNSADDLSLLRIINYPRRGMGDVAQKRIKDYAQVHQLSLAQALTRTDDVDGLSSQARRAGRDLAALLSRFQEDAGLSLAERVRHIAEESGIMLHLRQERTREADDRLENIGELISEAKRFEEEQGTADLGEFLGWVALVSDWDETNEDGGGVWLMTVHSAKGLEFPVVIVAGLEEGVFPHARSLQEGTVEEERRLMYVALTRAEAELYLTHAESRTMLGRTAMNAPSRFIREIPDALVSRGERLAAPDRATAAVSHRIEGLALGQKVRHPRFGWGTIVAMRGQGDDTEVTIAFPGGGVRSFMAKFAQLVGEETSVGGA
ncbi:MAG: ATP-dependent DNA helicase PcrA [Sulfobacillus acidophilus]|uniref:ATP-dependent DNA helicase PcrA n=1 Tax=Sulfobacillus acidophilus TaxID=53633 RepID=A0A2T2WGC2_9FIRM|nr:MAG: ATP-dependent DNA helicase PcrA [Sulfobacillus acidophilus]